MRLTALFSYQVYTKDKKVHDFQLKGELQLVEENSIRPNWVLLSYNRSITFYIYDRWIDIIRINPSDPYRHRVQKQSNPYQIISVFVWEDLLFYTDLFHIWLCYPALQDKEPSKIKLATIYPHSKEPVGT